MYLNNFRLENCQKETCIILSRRNVNIKKTKIQARNLIVTSKNFKINNATFYLQKCFEIVYTVFKICKRQFIQEMR